MKLNKFTIAYIRYPAVSIVVVLFLFRKTYHNAIIKIITLIKFGISLLEWYFNVLQAYQSYLNIKIVFIFIFTLTRFRGKPP